MDTMTTVSWIPRWVHDHDLAHFTISQQDGAGVRYRCARPQGERWPAIGDGLRRAGAALRAIPIAAIVAAIDHVAERWSDPAWPARQMARAQLSRATGFSLAAVDRSLDLELRNYRADSLWRALRRDLGDPACLDGFCDDRELEGRTHAIGPRVTLEVLTGNVPGLPALAIVRALLVKSALIAKVASGEPTFAVNFVASLARIAPQLADAILVTYWERGDTESLAAAVTEADAVIVYGSSEACNTVRKSAGNTPVFVEHGHKFSAGLMSRAYLAHYGENECARQIAEDVSAFNQHACIAPQAYIIEGSAVDVTTLAARVAEAMADYARNRPLGVLAATDAAALQMRRATQAWRAANSPDRALLVPDNVEWSVAVDSELPHEGAGNRFVTLVAVADLRQALELLAPFARHLQNAALGCLPGEMPAIAQDLARLGVCRLCGPGRMAEPSMTWRHDGRMCLAELVRWTDIEMHDCLRIDPASVWQKAEEGRARWPA